MCSSLKKIAHGSVISRENAQIMSMMPRHILEVIWHRIGQQMARALSTEMATRVLMDAETETPCK